MSDLPTGAEFIVKFPNARETLDEKKVLVQLEDDGKLKPLVGIFRVHGPPEHQRIDIECTGLRFRFDPPNTLGYAFHLSQRYVDTIPKAKPGGEVEFELGTPLLARD